MMAGEGARFRNENGRIPARQGLDWLKERPSFASSIWREQRVAAAPGCEEPSLEKVFFVPVARDGSVFNPGLARDGRFTIGPRGSEEQLATFEEALERLQKMSTPYWRCPNAQGHWGIVRGVWWERMDEPTLAEFAADPTRRLSPPVA